MKTSIDFVGSEAFELPSVWVPYSFRVLILTIFLLLWIELGALCVGAPARLCDTHPFPRSLFGFSPTEIVEEPNSRSGSR
jgi:hypothetical protein